MNSPSNDEYFNSPGYLIVCDEEGYTAQTEEEANFVTDCLEEYGIQKPWSVLDIGCGSGRHSVALSRRHLNVVGCDVSPQLIDQARKRAERYDCQILFQQMDMRQLNFTDAFQAVIFMFSSFGVFDRATNLEILRRSRQALTDQGLIILDIGNVYALLTYIQQAGSVTKRTISAQLTVTEDFRFDPLTYQLHWTEIHHWPDHEQIYEGLCQYYALPMLVNDLEKSRLIYLASYSSFDRQPYDGHSSNRLIVVAQKN
ncbi:class I SAM-dependent methyltransferase [Patescibacteria group bacterium]|nr:class I SAM-dependent methyltransferase [Patescibacteria group bacterium]MBU1906632.1 class I SAM-dependent methyltransferase [Patescibacteria group bacterium]